ncbi:MAG: rhodanese-like domain-containing protein, partial [Moraxellaceae bacterium]
MSVVHLNSVKTPEVTAANAQPDALSDVALTQARSEASALNLPYAGGVSPEDAWRLFTSGKAHIVDVRAIEERKFVGHVPGSIHVAWATGTSLTRNPRFVRELDAAIQKAGPNLPVLLLCRSGKRSVLAA